MHGKKCSDVMTKDCTCCLPKDTVNLAAQSMKAQDIGAVPVVDGHETKKLVGIVTDRDLALKVVAEGRDPRQTRIEEIMSRNLVMCNLQDDLQLALEAMYQRQRCLDRRPRPKMNEFFRIANGSRVTWDETNRPRSFPVRYRFASTYPAETISTRRRLRSEVDGFRVAIRRT